MASIDTKHTEKSNYFSVRCVEEGIIPIAYAVKQMSASMDEEDVARVEAEIKALKEQTK